jgi:hypothetical protein
MALNLNERVHVLDTIAASGADVSVVGGNIFITGADSINSYKVQGTPQYFGTSAGLPAEYLITSTATIAAATTYSGVIQQVLAGETINFPFSYTTVALPSAANFYIALDAVIQAGIDGGAVFGTLTNSASGVVFTGSVEAPVIAFASSTLTSTQTASTITATVITNAATGRIMTATTHGLTTGIVYNITFSGLAGVGAPSLNGRTYPCIPTTADSITIIGTSDTGAITNGTYVLNVNNNAFNKFYSEAGRITGYDVTKPYVGLQVAQVSEADVESGVVIPEVILVNATVATNSVANLAAFFGAINVGLA